MGMRGFVAVEEGWVAVLRVRHTACVVAQNTQSDHGMLTESCCDTIQRSRYAMPPLTPFPLSQRKPSTPRVTKMILIVSSKSGLKAATVKSKGS